MLRCFDTQLWVPAAVLSVLSSTLNGCQVDLGVGEEAKSDFSSTLSYAPVSNMVRAIVRGLCSFRLYFFDGARILACSSKRNYEARTSLAMEIIYSKELASVMFGRLLKMIVFASVASKSLSHYGFPNSE